MKTSFLLKQAAFIAVFVSCVTLLHALKFEIPDELKDEAKAQELAEKAALEEKLEQSEVEAESGKGDGRMSFDTGDNESSSADAEATAGESADLNEPGENSDATVEPEVFGEGEGRIAGQIFDKDTGQPLRGVAIVIEGSDLGTITDSQGRYRLNKVPTGEYTLSFIKSGYIEANVTETRVMEGELMKLDFALPPRPTDMSDEVYVLQGLTVTAQEAASQNVALLALRQNSIASIDALSSEDFAKFAASDIAEAMTKVSGASLSDGKYLVFRGLNDRYNTTLINGVILPSPDPDRKAVALDIFPTSLFESVIARKTYTSDMPGESSGGSVELRTKTVPDEPFVNMSYGIGMQEQTTGEDYLSDPERVNFGDWLFGDDKRGFKNIAEGTTLLSDYSNTVGNVNFPLTAPVARKAGVDQDFSFSAGGSKEINDWLTVGAIFGVKMSAKTRSKVTELNRTIFEDGLRIQDELGTVYSGSEEYDAAYLLGLGAQVGDRASFTYNYLRSDTISSEATIKDFFSADDGPTPPVQRRYLDSEILVQDRFLEAHQFGGEYLFSTGLDDWQFSWYYTRAEMGQTEPDQRLLDDQQVSEGDILGYLSPGSATEYSFDNPNGLVRKRLLRFNRETEQVSTMMGASISSPTFNITDDIAFSFDLGGSTLESERNFVQLETEIRNEAFVTNPLYGALPVPDGDGLNSLFPTGDYLDNAFFDQFVEDLGNDAETSMGGINGLILDVYGRQINVILPGQVNSQTTNLNNRQSQFNAKQSEVATVNTNLQSGITTFEGLFGIDFETQFDPSVPFQQFFYESFILPVEQELEVKQGELAQIQTEVDAAQQILNNTLGRLNTVTGERGDYIAEANALIAQISSMPAANMDSSAFPTYSYFGDTNYILDTPAGFSIYGEESPSDASNQFTNVLNKYVAQGKNEESSFFISGELELWDRIRIAGGVRRESTSLSYILLDQAPGEPPPQTGALGNQFKPFVVEESVIDQTDYLPYFSFIYNFTDNLKFQFSWSKTVAKPTFREIAPFPIYNLTDGSIEFGNPGLTVKNQGIIAVREAEGSPLLEQDYVVPSDFAGLDIAEVQSRDFRIEWFTPYDGLISVGYFFKTVGAPIERVQAFQLNGIDINTFVNNDNDADLRGFEIEIQQNLGVLNDFFDMDIEVLNWITIGGNYTDIDAEVERSTFEKGNLGNTDAGFRGQLTDPEVFQTGELSTRPLYDQPEFVANAFVTIDIEPTGTKFTLSQNWLGRQLSKAGGLTDAQGSADLFWEEFSALNLVIEQKLTDHLKLRFTAKNFNSPVRELSEDDSWNEYLVDGQRFLYNPGTNDPENPAYQAALAPFGAFRTRQTVEPSYSISISGSF